MTVAQFENYLNEWNSVIDHLPLPHEYIHMLGLEGVPDGRHQSRVKGHNGPFVVTYEYNAGYAAHGLAHSIHTSNEEKKKAKKIIILVHITVPQFSIYVTRIIYQPTLPTGNCWYTYTYIIQYIYILLCVYLTSFRCNFHHRWSGYILIFVA